jgi:hypothetical protein
MKRVILFARKTDMLFEYVLHMNHVYHSDIMNLGILSPVNVRLRLHRHVNRIFSRALKLFVFLHAADILLHSYVNLNTPQLYGGPLFLLKSARYNMSHVVFPTWILYSLSVFTVRHNSVILFPKLLVCEFPLEIRNMFTFSYVGTSWNTGLSAALVQTLSRKTLIHSWNMSPHQTGH